MNPINIAYPFRPARRSLVSAEVADLFGISETEPPHILANNLELDIQPGDLVLFTGPSGSGKSSILRDAGRPLDALDMATLQLPDHPLIDCLAGPIEKRLQLLAACGLSEARLLLRTPSELSDGERWRLRLALALQHEPRFLLMDEFAAMLERTLAKVIAFNVRKLCTRTKIGFLAATTHEDLLEDLNPDLHVRCLGDGKIEVQRRKAQKQPISFCHELSISEGSQKDWPRFARWHYRGHKLAFVKRVVLLRHGCEPVGICVFSSPAASLKLRSRYFGLSNTHSEAAMAALNEQLWLLARVVLHPTYRCAGIGADFVRRACESCPVPWIETLSAMGRVNPFFERAGFIRVGVVRKNGNGKLSRIYGPGRSVTSETEARSRFSEPVYYVFDNRRV